MDNAVFCEQDYLEMYCIVLCVMRGSRRFAQNALPFRANKGPCATFLKPAILLHQYRP